VDFEVGRLEPARLIYISGSNVLSAHLYFARDAEHVRRFAVAHRRNLDRPEHRLVDGDRVFVRACRRRGDRRLGGLRRFGVAAAGRASDRRSHEQRMRSH